MDAPTREGSYRGQYTLEKSAPGMASDRRELPPKLLGVGGRHLAGVVAADVGGRLAIAARAVGQERELAGQKIVGAAGERQDGVRAVSLAQDPEQRRRVRRGGL